MYLGKESAAAISEYLEASPEKRSLSKLGGIFWPTLMEGVFEYIRTEQDISLFLSEENDFINLGLTKELVENFGPVRSAIRNRTVPYPYISIRFLSDWIGETLSKIYSADKKELIEKDIERLKLEKKEVERELEEQQSGRKDFLLNELADSAERFVPVYIENMAKIDELFVEGLKTRSQSAKGTVMSVDDRRAVAARTARYQNELTKIKALSDNLKSEDLKKAFRTYNSQINSLMEKIISCDDLVALREDELLKLEDEQKKLSTAEIEGRMRSELEHLRDMTKVCARRLHLESCSLLRPDDKTFSLEKVCSCFDRILEFDPRLFNNFRAQMFGVPSALIIPGNGNAMFDWKNNQFLIPLIPPQGDFMGSIATAVIEYRLDVDEEKEMTTSYQRVPENKNIKSIISLHQALTKDYIRWMTFEYSGFKVLSKNVRYWFEHEVAPKKNEIYCPPEYQVFAMKPEVFKAVSDEIEERVSQSGSSTPAADLWKAHVFAFQKGKYADAGRYLEMLNSKPHKYLFSWFNLGIINAKIGKGQEAKAAYTEFIKRSPHCWWTTVAAEHLRSLT